MGHVFMEELSVLNGEAKYTKSLSAGVKSRGVNLSNNSKDTN
jgi:hypothetical protein